MQGIIVTRHIVRFGLVPGQSKCFSPVLMKSILQCNELFRIPGQSPGYNDILFEPLPVVGDGCGIGWVSKVAARIAQTAINRRIGFAEMAVIEEACSL